MSDQHSVIEHKANYHFLMIEEDYIDICKGKHEHCKAAILSILEHWMNSKRTASSTDDDLYVYLSYPQFVKRMFNLYGRNTIITSLEELEHDGLILKRPYIDAFNQETFEYRINRTKVQELLNALPDKPSSLNLNGGSLKLNGPRLETDDPSFKNKRGGSLNLNGEPFKNKRNIDTTKIQDTDTSQIDREERVATSAEDRNTPAPVLSSSSHDGYTNLAQKGATDVSTTRSDADSPPSQEQEHMVRSVAVLGGAAPGEVPTKRTLIIRPNCGLPSKPQDHLPDPGNDPLQQTPEMARPSRVSTPTDAPVPSQAISEDVPRTTAQWGSSASVGTGVDEVEQNVSVPPVDPSSLSNISRAAKAQARSADTSVPVLPPSPQADQAGPGAVEPGQQTDLFGEPEQKTGKGKGKRSAVTQAESPGPPQMPPEDAPWNDETGVQIVEAINGRRYSETTRKQELIEVKKIRAMPYKDGKITRQQFELAWRKMISWPFWSERDIKPMIKHLRKDDKILNILETMERESKPKSAMNGNGAHPPVSVSGRRRLDLDDDPPVPSVTYTSRPRISHA